jgi:hypothetical protein
VGRLVGEASAEGHRALERHSGTLRQWDLGVPSRALVCEMRGWAGPVLGSPCSPVVISASSTGLWCGL